MKTRIGVVRAGVTNTWVVRDEGALVIDPGGLRQGRRVLRKLRRLLGERAKIHLIIATHGHFDHVGAAGVLREGLGAPFAVHRGDVEWVRTGTWTWPRGLTPWGRAMRAVLGPVLERTARFPPLEPDIVIGDGGLDLRTYGIAGKVVATPGHSPGSVSVLLDGGEAFVGDLAMNGAPMCLGPSFGIFAHEPRRVPESWCRLQELGVRVVYPAHGRPFPAAALDRRLAA